MDDVTNAVTDVEQLADMALSAKETLGLTQTEVVADKGYYSAAEVSRCVAQNITPYIPKFKLGKTLAEHPYGTIKRWMGFTHFSLQRLVKVRTEWSLVTLAYNLKRVLNLVSFEKLMAAVG